MPPGLTPTSLIGRDSAGSSSLLDEVVKQIAEAVGSDVGDVHVFNVREAPGTRDSVDVYYAVSRDTHPVTYLRPSRLDGSVWLRKEQVSQRVFIEP